MSSQPFEGSRPILRVASQFDGWSAQLIGKSADLKGTGFSPYVCARKSMWALQAAEKTYTERQEVSGHNFESCRKYLKINVGFSP